MTTETAIPVTTANALIHTSNECKVVQGSFSPGPVSETVILVSRAKEMNVDGNLFLTKRQKPDQRVRTHPPPHKNSFLYPKPEKTTKAWAPKPKIWVWVLPTRFQKKTYKGKHRSRSFGEQEPVGENPKNLFFQSQVATTSVKGY